MLTIWFRFAEGVPIAWTDSKREAMRWPDAERVTLGKLNDEQIKRLWVLYPSLCRFLELAGIWKVPT